MIKHSLLLRQLKKSKIPFDSLPSSIFDFEKFLSQVNEAYNEFDQRILMLERMVTVSVGEMTKLYDMQKASSELILKNAVEALNAGFLLIDSELNIVIANSNFKNNYKLFDDECSTGFSYARLLENLVNRGIHKSTGLSAEAWISLQKNQLTKFDTPFEQSLNGKIFLVSAQKTSFGGIVILQTDITERKKLEDDLAFQQKELLKERQISVQSAKLSSLGEMAAGIAHEINNPLAIIAGKAEMLKKHSEQGTMSQDYANKNLETIIATVRRIAKIVVSLRNFSRDASGEEMVKMTVGELLEDVASLCQERFKNHGVEFSIPQNPIILSACLQCRPIQIQQVLINMLNNSFDAIESLETKWIKVEVFDQDSSFEINVRDSGLGIPSDIAAKIFEPFYTTKQVGKGTGVGLSMAFGIIKSHGGTIELDSQSPHTCFRIILPKNIEIKAAS